MAGRAEWEGESKLPSPGLQTGRGLQEKKREEDIGPLASFLAPCWWLQERCQQLDDVRANPSSALTCCVTLDKLIPLSEPSSFHLF